MKQFNPQPKPEPRPKKEQKPISKRTAKKEYEIELAKQYYKESIEANRVRNKGVVRCDECEAVISIPIGRNVAHIIGKGANSSLYLNPINHFILCYNHVIQEESGSRKTMKIYPEWQRSRLELLQSLIK